jgi:hypothetical protein
VDNYDIYSIKPVDNSMIWWVYETFSDRYARTIYILKLHGLSPTNPYGWIKPGYLTLWHIGYNQHMGLSNDERKSLQQKYFNDIKFKNIVPWSLCYICRKPRHMFIPVEDIPMPVCKEHSWHTLAKLVKWVYGY